MLLLSVLSSENLLLFLFHSCQAGAGAGHSHLPIALFLSGRCHFRTLKGSLTIEGEGNDFGVWPDCFKIKMKTFKSKSPVTKAYWYILVLCGRGCEKARMLTNFIVPKVTIQDFNFILCKRNIGFMRTKSYDTILPTTFILQNAM